MEKYNEKIKDAKNVEMVYFSRDSSEGAMESFMAEFKMPWPAIDFDKKDRWKLGATLAGNVVPNYVLIDAEGEVLANGSGGVFAALEKLK